MIKQDSRISFLDIILCSFDLLQDFKEVFESTGHDISVIVKMRFRFNSD